MSNGTEEYVMRVSGQSVKEVSQSLLTILLHIIIVQEKCEKNLNVITVN